MVPYQLRSFKTLQMQTSLSYLKDNSTLVERTTANNKVSTKCRPISKYFLLQVHNSVTRSTVQVALKLSL